LCGGSLVSAQVPPWADGPLGPFRAYSFGRLAASVSSLSASRRYFRLHIPRSASARSWLARCSRCARSSRSGPCGCCSPPGPNRATDRRLSARARAALDIWPDGLDRAIASDIVSAVRGGRLVIVSSSVLCVPCAAGPPAHLLTGACGPRTTGTSVSALTARVVRARSQNPVSSPLASYQGPYGSGPSPRVY